MFTNLISTFFLNFRLTHLGDVISISVNGCNQGDVLPSFARGHAAQLIDVFCANIFGGT
jgi:hypothetical protein